jgi:hypothetical protein
MLLLMEIHLSTSDFNFAIYLCSKLFFNSNFLFSNNNFPSPMQKTQILLYQQFNRLAVQQDV